MVLAHGLGGRIIDTLPALLSGDKPLAGAAKSPFVKKCEADAKAGK